MYTDEQYGRQLGVRLRHETADVHAAPDLMRTLRRRRAGRSWAIRTAIAAPVATAAAAALLVTMPGQGLPDRAPHQNGAQVQWENVSYVQEQTIRALGQASQYVIHAQNSYEGGHYDEWIDRATGRYRNDVYTRQAPATPAPAGQGQAPPRPGDQAGGPVHLDQSHSVRGPDGNQEIVTVDYDLKRWWRGSDAKPAMAGPDITDADSVRDAVRDGTVELLGRERVDGVDTLRLRLFGPDRSYRIDMWVDKTTYLPVRQITAKGDGQVFPAEGTVTTTYTWLPRTGENLARLVLTPPPGFVQTK